LLLAITMFSTGQAVIDEIWRQDHRLLIVPRKSRRPLYDGTIEAAWRPSSTSTVGYSPQTSVDDTRLDFMSRDWEICWLVNTDMAPMAAGNDRAEALLHEMVHALAMMAGHDTGSRPLPGRWDSEDEFRAILVTDIYASERGRPLTRTHDGGASMAMPGDWSANQDLQRLLARFSTAQPGLVTRLRSIETPFNPFRGSFQFTDAMR
jgi:hypothetical protein